MSFPIDGIRYQDTETSYRIPVGAGRVSRGCFACNSFDVDDPLERAFIRRWK